MAKKRVTQKYNDPQTTFRFPANVRRAIAEMARVESRETGLKMTNSDIVRKAILERLERVRKKRKT